MYFDQDTGLDMSSGTPTPIHLLRVEHYGKGAAEVARYAKSRPVPAVTGAFISIDRAWYEELGGFTEEFIFGHYEDADLCLKSLERGYPAWMHDLDLWHLEGKGSTRKLPHEGGSAVNRWLFAEKWGQTVRRGLIGPAPAHRLLNLQSASAS
jgi:GT2 family glycosyltransferase